MLNVGRLLIILEFGKVGEGKLGMKWGKKLENLLS